MRLEHIQRDFSWGGGSLDKKPHLVKYSSVCLDKKDGGLQVRCLNKLNKALLCKWLWCFPNEGFSLKESHLFEVWGRKWGLVFL